MGMGQARASEQDRLLQFGCCLVKLQRPEGYQFLREHMICFESDYRYARRELWLGQADVRIPGSAGLREAWTELDLLSALLRVRRGSGRRLSVPEYLQARIERALKYHSEGRSHGNAIEG